MFVYSLGAQSESHNKANMIHKRAVLLWSAIMLLFSD